MAEPFLSELRIFSFSFAPKGWVQCDGQLLPINQNQALFSLLGTTYGGDGRVNFGLPNLQGRVPLHQGQGIILGDRSGEESHTLIQTEMPIHTHVPIASGPAAATTPSGNLLGKGTSVNFYDPNTTTSMHASTVSNTGGSQPHPNMQPYLVLNICIALQGIFPSQN